MRATEFLIEATSLTLAKVTKYPERPERFFELITQGHIFNSKIGPVKLDPSQIGSLRQQLKKENVGKLRTINIKILDNPENPIIPMSHLFYDDTAFSMGGKRSSKGGESDLQIKPGQVFGHKDPEKGQEITPELAIDLGAFAAGQLGKKIQSNQTIQEQGKVGQDVINISKQISSGQVPDVPKDLSSKELTSIQNDAFEYLGVQALIDGVADFPNSEAFYKHIGSDLKNMLLLFPSKSNNPLADSFALQGKNNNKIYLSSKGGKRSGAAQSIAEVILPQEFQQSSDDETIKFIKLIQGTKPAWLQPFRAAEAIKESYPNALGELSKFVPFDRGLLNYLSETWKNQNQGVPESYLDVPKEFQPFFKVVQAATSDSDIPLFYNTRQYVKTKVHEAINSSKAFPNFSSKMLEILGHNFVVLKTKPASGKFVTTVSWPSKMGGKITFEHKDPANKWGSSMTWKLK